MAAGERCKACMIIVEVRGAEAIVFETEIQIIKIYWIIMLKGNRAAHMK
jgi:hypothetical protein